MYLYLISSKNFVFDLTFSFIGKLSNLASHHGGKEGRNPLERGCVKDIWSAWVYNPICRPRYLDLRHEYHGRKD